MSPRSFFLFGVSLLLLVACSSKESKEKLEETYPIYKVTLEPEMVSILEGESFQLSAGVFPSNNTDYTIEWKSNNTDIVVVDNNGLIKAIKAGDAIVSANVKPFEAHCSVSVKKHIPTTAVDIGLSAYWAECNIGASKPEEFGDYYAWGEIVTKAVFTYDTYKWYLDGAYVIKYCPAEKTDYWGGEGDPDNLLVLEKEDDVASVLLGGDWHIPTYEEVAELINTQKDQTNYNWTWVDVNGQYGWRVLYNKNGNSIFLPAAGFGGNDMYKNVFGAYWTSSLYDPYSAKALHFRDEGYGAYFNEGAIRYCGFSIRPVWPAQ